MIKAGPEMSQDDWKQAQSQGTFPNAAILNYPGFPNKLLQELCHRPGAKQNLALHPKVD